MYIYIYVYIYACMWTHICARTHLALPHKMILRPIVHIFQIRFQTFLYVYVCACLWLGNSQVYICDFICPKGCHITGMVLTQCGPVTPHISKMGQLWLSLWLAAWWHQAIARITCDLQSIQVILAHHCAHIADHNARFLFGYVYMSMSMNTLTAKIDLTSLFP